MKNARKSPDLMALGGRLQELRKQKGLGLREVARLSDISPTYLLQVERGDSRRISEEKLLHLAKVLDCDPPFSLLAQAGRVPKAIVDAFARHPDEVHALMVEMKGCNSSEWKRLLEQVRKWRPKLGWK